MNKIFLIVIIIILLLFPLNISLAQEEETAVATNTAIEKINSFELFWPITAGRVRGEGLYSVKLLKENLREFLIFSDLKKSEYNVSLSTKRVVEAEKLLLEKKDYTNAALTLDYGKQKRVKAVDLIRVAQAKNKNISEVKREMISVFERQRALLNYVLNQVPGDQKSIVEDSISDLNSLLSTIP